MLFAFPSPSIHVKPYVGHEKIMMISNNELIIVNYKTIEVEKMELEIPTFLRGYTAGFFVLEEEEDEETSSVFLLDERTYEKIPLITKSNVISVSADSGFVAVRRRIRYDEVIDVYNVEGEYVYSWNVAPGADLSFTSGFIVARKDNILYIIGKNGITKYRFKTKGINLVKAGLGYIIVKKYRKYKSDSYAILQLQPKRNRFVQIAEIVGICFVPTPVFKKGLFCYMKDGTPVVLRIQKGKEQNVEDIPKMPIVTGSSIITATEAGLALDAKEKNYLIFLVEGENSCY